MSDGIYTAETGLAAFEKGLQAISNDTSNMNTPGYKGSGVLFADLVGGNGMNGEGAGEGVMTVGTAMNFSSGQLQSTGNPLDLAINGNGFFTLEDAEGNIHYTQDGQFEFNSAGFLVSSSTQEKVMALQDGKLAPISIANAAQNPALATQNVVLAGNLLSTSTTPITVSGVTVVDGAGVTHTLTLTFTPSTSNGTAAAAGNVSWNITLASPDTLSPPITFTQSPATLTFNAAGSVATTQTPITLQYTMPGSSTPSTVTLNLASATSNISTTATALAESSQDGFASGSGQLQQESFDSNGKLVLTYSGGQVVQNGPQLALANFISPDDLQAASSNEFTAKSNDVQVGVAGSGVFGTIESGEIEGSNVDLSQEFSNLVIMQRGYQACSQVISTASDMLSSLFDMVVK